MKRDIHCTLFLGDQIYNKINDLWISLRLKRKKKKEKEVVTCLCMNDQPHHPIRHAKCT